MSTATVYCFPRAGTTHHIHVDEREESVTLYLQGVSHGAVGLLQCWTDLPHYSSCALDEDLNDSWHAIDDGQFQGQEEEQSLVREVVVSTAVLERYASQDQSLAFSFAWRIALTDDNNDQPVNDWLNSPGWNGVLHFHIARQDSLQRLINDLHVIEGAEYIKEEEVVVMSIHLDVTLDIKSKQSFQIIHPSRAITGGATWERTKSTWHTSRSFSSMSDISEVYLASLIVLQYSDVDKVLVILPVCTDTANVGLVQREGALHAVVDQFQEAEEAEYRVVMAVGPTSQLHGLIRRCFHQVNKNKTIPMLPSQSPLLGSNGLGFCSWEALGAGKERPFLSKLVMVLDRVEKRSPSSIATLLIDDGWQDIAKDEGGSRRLRGFDIDPALTEDEVEGGDPTETRLATYITSLRKQYTQIKSFGVWMTLAGYWDGLDHQAFNTSYGPLVEARLATRFWPDTRESRWWLPAFNKLEAFYTDYFSFLEKAGISFVKVDDQADWEWITKLVFSSATCDVAPSTYYDNAWKAMTNAANKHFGDLCVINCMSMGHRFITAQTIEYNNLHLARNSDDTFPKVPQSHNWHIYHNAMNAGLMSGSGNILPDADMFTSCMPSEATNVADWADYHAAFRACFSPSAIWLSDSVEVSDKANASILDRLLAPSKDTRTKATLGRLKTVQVSSQSNNLPLPDSIFANLTEEVQGPALKMSVGWSSTSKQVSGAVLSAWNTRYQSTSIDSFATADIYQALKEQDKIASARLFLFSPSNPEKAVCLPSMSQDEVQIHRHRSAITSKPLIPLKLKPASYCILSVISAFSLTQDDWSGSVCCVGLIDKYNGLMAVIDAGILQGDGFAVSASLSRAGRCGFLVHDKALAEVQRWSARIDGRIVAHEHVNMKQVQDCVLIVVDMVKHLLLADFFDGPVEDVWRVEILM